MNVGIETKQVPSVAGKGQLFIDFYLFNEGNFVSIIYSAFSTSELSPFFVKSIDLHILYKNLFVSRTRQYTKINIQVYFKLSWCQ